MFFFYFTQILILKITVTLYQSGKMPSCTDCDCTYDVNTTVVGLIPSWSNELLNVFISSF